MNRLLESRAFRAVLAARSTGVPSDTALQTSAAQRVTKQMETVLKRTVGSIRYNIAVGSLMEYIRLYLNAYDENREPYLPEGISEDSFG